MRKKVSVKELTIPTTSQLEEELSREKYKFRYKKLLKSTVYALIIVISLSVLASTLLFSLLEICGESMAPTLKEREIVISIKKPKYKNGDVIAFYYNNQILVKRVIATSSEWVSIDSDGNVFVNDELLDEDYVEERFYGDVDIEFPYQVPEGSYFVLGDKREKSIDSRNSLIGCILEDEIIGKIMFKVWPIKEIGIVR